ncbi:MAG: hypothetical protein ABIM82_05425, partial [candidate division WOR-3 bacterium]
FGFYFGAHPLTPYLPFIKFMDITNSSDLVYIEEAREINLCGFPADIKIMKGKNGVEYFQVEFEDLYGTFKVNVFGEILEKFKNNFKEEKVYYIKGLYSPLNSSKKGIIKAVEIIDMDKIIKNRFKKMVIVINTNEIEKEDIKKLKEIISKYKGDKELWFEIKEEGRIYIYRAKGFYVNPDYRLFDEIKEIIGEERVILR